MESKPRPALTGMELSIVELVQKLGLGLPEPQLAERRRFIGHNIG
jgi:hypothetical protein